MLFAYFGPDAMLPLTSVLATIVGVVLMFGRQAIQIPIAVGRKLVRSVGFGPRRAKSPPGNLDARYHRIDAAARSTYPRPASPSQTEAVES